VRDRGVVINAVATSSGRDRLGAAFARWWWHSRFFDAVYVAIAAAGAVLFFLVVLDSAASWPTDHVLIAPGTLEQVAAWLILPAWVVMLISLFGVGATRHRSSKLGFPPDWSVRRRATTVICVLLLGMFVVGNFLLGADKGSVRVLPGPQYQVSSYSRAGGEWTTVSLAEYRRSAARFVREDAALTFFGAAEVVGAIGVLVLRRRGPRKHESDVQLAPEFLA
jgi:hypothetical protein